MNARLRAGDYLRFARKTCWRLDRERRAAAIGGGSENHDVEPGNEGYGPGGAFAVIVEALTDNRNCAAGLTSGSIFTRFPAATFMKPALSPMLDGIWYRHRTRRQGGHSTMPRHNAAIEAGADDASVER